MSKQVFEQDNIDTSDCILNEAFLTSLDDKNIPDKSQDDGNTKTSSIQAPKKQSIQSIYHFLTWNNYPENWLEILEPFLQQNCSQWVFQKEVGENGTPHIQGNIKVHKKRRWESFGLPKGIHWEKTRNIKAAFEYCAKESTREGENYWFYPPRIIKGKLKLINELRPWQQTVVNMLQDEPDDRTVNWIYDQEGCMGKTVFSKYLYSKHDAIIATGGGNKDIACLIALLLKDGRDLNIKTTFVFNFPRSTEGVSYKAIESVKDGLMTSVKYETSTLVFNSPHVWVFSNELPEYHKLTKDKWAIWTIEDSILVKYFENKEGTFELC